MADSSVNNLHLRRWLHVLDFSMMVRFINALCVFIGLSNCPLAKELPVFLFKDLISENYGFEVKEWSGAGHDTLRQIAIATSRHFNENPQHFDRTNEVGLSLEKDLQRSFEAFQIPCWHPSTQSGRRQLSGYPDLSFEMNGELFYLEVKTFSSRTIHSSQRTFYFTVSEDPKVDTDAFHLLLGFEIQKTDDTHYKILGYHLLDLRNLPCKVKVEYNASNKDLYGADGFGFRISEKITTD